MSENNKPVEVIRDGNLKASIFRNEGEKGPFFSTTLARTYTDDRGMHDTNVFSGTDLLRVSELARKAYSTSRDLQKQLGKPRDLFQGERENSGRTSEEFDRQNGRTRSRSRSRELRR